MGSSSEHSGIENRPLKIYTASAGSGKTHQLTVEYLCLLMNDSDPRAFRRILAVTFTRKATTEMKHRIISELYNISKGRPSGVGDSISSRLGLSQDIMALRGQVILKAIINDYSAFRICTIDSFFQEIVRSFALELDQDHTFGIELDDDAVITTSVDRLISRLSSDDEKLSGLLRFFKELYKKSIEDEMSPNLLTQIKALAVPFIFDDEVQKVELDEHQYSVENVSKIQKSFYAAMKTMQNEAQDYVTSLKQLIEAHHLDLSASPYRVLEKLMNTLSQDEGIETLLTAPDDLFKVRLVSILDDEKPFYKASAAPEVKSAYNACSDQLRTFLKGLREYGASHREDYITYLLLLSYLDVMPALFALKKDIEAYREENNCLLISDINHLLHGIIDGSDIPFVYEKVGERIDHYMIDEFQDTNPLQWENFKPLLEHSLSKGKSSLIVGDVKQSIYRFRGTDSSLLGLKVPNDPDIGRMVAEYNLETNWRSRHGIIHFNNAFFTDIYQTISSNETEDDIEVSQMGYHKVAYHEAQQELSPRDDRDGGYVTITAIEAGTKAVYNEAVLPMLEELLVDLQTRRGYRPGDIALLVRTRGDGIELAEMLSVLSVKYKDCDDVSFEFVSDEALLVSKSSVVQLLTALIRYYAHPSTPLDREITLHLDRFVYRAMTDAEARGETYERSPESLKERLLSLAATGRSLYETVAMAIEVLGTIPEEDEIYVNAFLDIVFDYTSRRLSTYERFSQWWESHYYSQKISMGDSGNNSMTLLTIHKSKGLEFPIVIMPFATWEITKTRGGQRPLLVSSNGLPETFQGLPFYFVSRRLKMIEQSYLSPYADEIYEEDLMDNLNLLYVAFTRAGSELHLFMNSKGGDNSSQAIICERLTAIQNDHSLDLEETTGTVPDVMTKKNEPVEYTTYHNGSPTIAPATADVESKIIPLKGLVATPRYDDLVLSQREYLKYMEQNKELKRGLILHEVMSEITHAADFDEAIDRRVQRSELTSDDGETIKRAFAQALRHEQVSQWFDPSWGTPIVERELLTSRGVYRPDRVIISGRKVTVIDYKFGEHHDTKYRKQIARYMRLFVAMGYVPVEGYIWYNLSDDIVPVTL